MRRPALRASSLLAARRSRRPASRFPRRLRLPARRVARRIRPGRPTAAVSPSRSRRDLDHRSPDGRDGRSLDTGRTGDRTRSRLVAGRPARSRSRPTTARDSTSSWSRRTAASRGASRRRRRRALAVVDDGRPHRLLAASDTDAGGLSAAVRRPVAPPRRCSPTTATDDEREGRRVAGRQAHRVRLRPRERGRRRRPVGGRSAALGHAIACNAHARRRASAARRLPVLGARQYAPRVLRGREGCRLGLGGVGRATSPAAPIRRQRSPPGRHAARAACRGAAARRRGRRTAGRIAIARLPPPEPAYNGNPLRNDDDPPPLFAGPDAFRLWMRGCAAAGGLGGTTSSSPIAPPARSTRRRRSIGSGRRCAASTTRTAVRDRCGQALQDEVPAAGAGGEGRGGSSKRSSTR